MPNILVVDDDRTVQQMLVDLLTEHGYDTDTSRNGREALARLDAEKFDLMLLDVLVPHINGFALMEQIRQLPKLRDLPVIMMSGIYRSRNHRSDMTSRFGVLDYLDKPIDTEHLLELIKNAVGAGTGGRRATVPDVKDDTALMAPTSDEGLVEPEAREEKAQVEADARDQFRTSAFVMQGSLKKTPVAAVLGKLWREGASGALLLRNDKVKKIVYLSAGNVHGVKSNLVSECLGRILVRERMIKPEQCEASIKLMKDTGKRQGEILVGMNVITQRNLAFALELQLETKLFDLFHWDAGEYRFNPSVIQSPAEATLEWQGPALIVEGIRRGFDETRLRSLMVPILDVPLRYRDPAFDLAALRLQRQELRAAASIRSGVTTRDLLDALPLDPPDALRLVYTLIALDLLLPAA